MDLAIFYARYRTMAWDNGVKVGLPVVDEDFDNFITVRLMSQQHVDQNNPDAVAAQRIIATEDRSVLASGVCG